MEVDGRGCRHGVVWRGLLLPCVVVVVVVAAASFVAAFVAAVAAARYLETFLTCVVFNSSCPRVKRKVG